MSATCEHRLDGFEPDNLLAFMALLGLLRALDTARPTWRARAFWDDRHHPLRPVLTLKEAHTIDEIAEGAVKGLGSIGRAMRKLADQAHAIDAAAAVEKLRSPERMAELTKRSETIDALDESEADPEQEGLLGGLARNRLDKGEWTYGTTPLKFAGGQMAFVGTLLELTENSEPKALARALAGPWSNADRGDTLRLGPAEARRYALMKSDPAMMDTRSEAGANALACAGFLSFPIIITRSGNAIPGMGRVAKRAPIRWPIWRSSGAARRGASLARIEALMRHPELTAKETDETWMSQNDILAVCQADRFNLGDQGNYYNVSPAVRLTPQQEPAV